MAVSVVIPTLPVKLILSMPVALLVSPPVPANAVVTVSVLLFVRVTPVAVTLGMKKVPVSACAFVSKVWTPVPAAKVPLLVIPPRKVMAEFPELFQVPPALIVTDPVNVLAPVAEDIVKLPLVPTPTVVVPVTVNAKPAMVKEVPSPTTRFPPMVKAAAVFAVAVPLRVKLPSIVVTLVKVLALVPLNARW